MKSKKLLTYLGILVVILLIVLWFLAARLYLSDRGDWKCYVRDFQLRLCDSVVCCGVFLSAIGIYLVFRPVILCGGLSIGSDPGYRVIKTAECSALAGGSLAFAGMAVFIAGGSFCGDGIGLYYLPL